MKLLFHLKKSEAIKQSTYMLSGNTIASGIAAVAIILYSRLLGPDKFGAFSVGFAFIQLIARLGDGGINIAVQKNLSQTFESDKNTARSYVHHGTKAKMYIALGLAVLFLGLSQPIATHWLKTEYIQIVRLSVIFAMINIAYDYIAVIHQSIHRFSASINMNLIQSTLKAFWAILLWSYSISSPVIAFLLYSISPIIGVIYGLLALPAWLKKFSGNYPNAHKKILMHTAKFTSIAVVAGAIGDNIDVLMVKGFLSDYQTGLYAAGVKLSILVSIIGYSLGSVLNPRVSRYRDTKNLKKYIKKAALISSSLIAVSFLILPITKYLIIFTAGQEYLSATSTVQMLLIAAFVAAATAPFVSIFYAIDSPSYFAVAGLIEAFTLIAGNLIFIPSHGIEGAGFTKLVMRLTVLLFTVIFASFMIKKAHGQHIHAILKNP